MGGGKTSSHSAEFVKSQSCESSVALVGAEDNMKTVVQVPIVLSFNDRIRPLLDAVDKLRHLKIMKQGIQLPTIVVVGDQSSGKSSVLESLAGINLPRGQGICTRAPLILRLKHHSDPEPELSLEYNGKTVSTDEAHVAESINAATDDIAGYGKGISNVPLTLVVKKFGVPDLTMVDLPGITRVPVHGQPENIYEQITDIIMEYITPGESIILNVLSANVDFSTCESIRMSQKVDKTGERTLAVVTKADKAPEGLLEKVTADDVNIGLGYVCVRNRIGDESYEEARGEEAALFGNHPLLSKIDKSMVGIPVLAQKLTLIQATIIARCLPGIVKNVNEKLNANISELKKMPKKMSSVGEAMATLMGIIGAAKESLRKILMRGEFDEYPDDRKLHCTARLVEMLDQFSDELQGCSVSDPTKNFLVDEIEVLEEATGIELPNFLPHSVFKAILSKKVDGISYIPVNFVEKMWNYVEEVVFFILMQKSENCHELMSITRRAGRNIITKMKEQSMNWVTEMIEMEKLTDYTCNPEYLKIWNSHMSEKLPFLEKIQWYGASTVDINGFGNVAVGDLMKHQRVLHQAFDLKMRMVSYWKIVLWRMVDAMALHLQHGVRNLVNKELEKEVLNELDVANPCAMERMLEEAPSVARKRKNLKASIKVLQESRDVLSEIRDKITFDDA